MAFSKNIGHFYPTNKQKYKGDVDGIVFRSNLEKFYFNFFDKNKDVLFWNSEEVVVPYTSPVDGKNHRYFVDCWVKVKNKSGKIKEYLIEIKPDFETKPPILPKSGKMTNTYKRQCATWLVNNKKWDAATIFADRNNMEFVKLTEKDK